MSDIATKQLMEQQWAKREIGYPNHLARWKTTSGGLWPRKGASRMPDNKRPTRRKYE